MKTHRLCGMILVLILLVTSSEALVASPPTSPHEAAGSGSAASDPTPVRSIGSLCPPLPPPTGEVVYVSSVAELQSAVNNAASNSTILVTDGTYNLHGVYLWFDTPGVTLRSASGNREAVVINPHEAKVHFPDNGTVACSHIEMTDTGRPHVNPTAGGCYTGGVDAHYAWGWTIRDNLIEGFWCEHRLSEHGIHLPHFDVYRPLVLRNYAP